MGLAQMLPSSFNYACFVSFSQRDKENDSAAFDRFLRTLHAQLDANARRNSKNETYFLINEQAVAGDYRDELARGLTQSVCCLSLYSPNYWTSDECRDERTAFLERNLVRRYGLNERRHLEYFAAPWRFLSVDVRGSVAERVFPDDISQPIRQLSYLRDEHKFPYVYREGLLAALKSTEEAKRQEATKYIELLADEISAVIEVFCKASVPPRPVRRGTLYVLAARPLDIEQKLSQLTPERKQIDKKCELYLTGGGPDWHPFSPGDDTRSIGRLVSDVVRREIKDDVMDLLKANEPQERLQNVIHRAGERQEYVIVVVDPWSIHHFDHLRMLLDGLDQQKHKNLLLVIVRDPTTVEGPDSRKLDKTIEETFHEFLDDSTWYFVKDVSSEQEFLHRLQGLFVRLRTKMQANRHRAVDSSGPAIPAVL